MESSSEINLSPGKSVSIKVGLLPDGHKEDAGFLSSSTVEEIH